MYYSRRKIPGKNLIRRRCAVEFNSGVKGLKRVDQYLHVPDALFAVVRMFHHCSLSHVTHTTQLAPHKLSVYRNFEARKIPLSKKYVGHYCHGESVA
jgi:hypothetical protein